MAAKSDGDLAVELDPSNLREVLAAAKEFNPALARSLRRKLRSTGDEVIAEQKTELDGPLPPGVQVAGKTTRLILPKDGRRPYFRRVNVYEERARASDNRRSTGMRDRIKDSLRTRVVAGKTRQGVQVRADSRRSDMTHAWESKLFRHPVFGHGGSTFVPQRGRPYFWGPAVRGRARAAERVGEALTEAVNVISKGKG
jgi:hypothetical protein